MDHLNEKANDNKLFPVFLKLEQMQLLLVGAGNAGLEKLKAVLDNAPLTRITVVAKNISDEVRSLAAVHSNIRLEERAFEREDLDDKDLVIVAINDKDAGAAIRQAARRKSLLVNVADKPELCDFYLGAIVRKGPVKIAISTNGQSPTLARRLKEVLQEAIPEGVHQLAANLQLIRSRLKGSFSEKVEKLNQLTGILIEKDKTT